MAWVLRFCRSTLGVLGCLALACSTTDDDQPGAEGFGDVGDTGTTMGPAQGDTGPAMPMTTQSSDSGDTAGMVGTSGAWQCEDGDDGWGSGDEGDSSGGDGDGDGTIGMGDDMPLATNVYDVQKGDVPPGTLVSMTDLVVTTPSTPSESGIGYEFFVQAIEGGPWSGIRVRVPYYDPRQLVAPGASLALIGRTLGQHGYVLIEIAGSGAALSPGAVVAPPTPIVLPAETLTPDNPEVRAYEGVLVRVEEVIVTDPDPCDGEFVVDQVLRIDDRFAPDLAQPQNGSVINAVSGVLVYALDAYELAPPDSAAIE